MTGPLPLFPLGSVLFPGATLPLRVFEDRYRALVEHLVAIPDPAQRLFGSVAIREGYEVGEHGHQSLYRVGVRLQLTEVEQMPDGTFEVLAVGRDRFRLDRVLTDRAYPCGEASVLPGDDGLVPDGVVETARATFTAYRAAVLPWREDPLEGRLPTDPEHLSWVLSASAPLPMADRQSLLEASSTLDRLVLVTDLLRGELRAMNVVPSLPASQLARTRWSPN
jgi:hypothetical protein